MVDEIVMTPVAASINSEDAPTPHNAVTIGMPAAMAEPSVTNSTMSATMTPNTSVIDSPGISTANASPPIAT